MIQFDEHIFQMGWFSHHLVKFDLFWSQEAFWKKSELFWWKSLSKKFCCIYIVYFEYLRVWWRGDEWVLVLILTILESFAFAWFYGLLFAAGVVPRTNSSQIFRESSKAKSPQNGKRNLPQNTGLGSIGQFVQNVCPGSLFWWWKGGGTLHKIKLQLIACQVWEL